MGEQTYQFVSIQSRKLYSKVAPYTYKEITELTYKLVLPTDYYADDNEDGIWEDKSEDPTHLKWLYSSKATPLKITGIIRPAEGVSSTALTGSIGYTYKLTEWYINQINNSDIVKQQKSPSFSKDGDFYVYSLLFKTFQKK